MDAVEWSHESQRTPVLEVVRQVVWMWGHQLVLPGSLKPLFSSLTLALLVTSGQPGLRPGAPQKDSLLPQVTGRMREACTLLENPVSGQGLFFCVCEHVA